jgi:hypothetical protein
MRKAEEKKKEVRLEYRGSIWSYHRWRSLWFSRPGAVLGNCRIERLVLVRSSPWLQTEITAKTQNVGFKAPRCLFTYIPVF